MITIRERTNEDGVEPRSAAEIAGQLTASFEARGKSRRRATLDDGREVALFLPRGTQLRGGDLLRAEGGALIRVAAAAESCSLAEAKDPKLLARAAYHLGNRHVALEIGEGWLRYLHDHVLDEMVRQLGLEVRFEEAPFEPEAGAYAHGHGGHGHGAHGHDHEH